MMAAIAETLTPTKAPVAVTDARTAAAVERIADAADHANKD